MSVMCATKHSPSADNSNCISVFTAMLSSGRSERQFHNLIWYEPFPASHFLVTEETHVRRFKCSMCSVTCQGVAGLREHLRIHTGERPFSCSQCERRFKRLQVPSCTLTHKVTNFIENSTSWEANSNSSSQEIPLLLWNLNVHYHVQKSPLLVSILSQIHPVHTFLSCVPRSLEWSLPVRFSNQNIVSIFHVPHVLHAPSISSSSSSTWSPW
jgi:hypothetical protein